ncbi:MAG: hypothetical protein LC777_18270 [Actinobacteria bacterium]|nr:hypothetical protein [Actinomycetota bacterium]
MADAGELDVAGLTGADVSAFLLAECARVSVGSAKGRTAELRSLLRSLYLRRFMDIALADSVPSVAGWRDTEIPATISPGDVQRLLACVTGRRSAGRATTRFMLLLAWLGLRSIEVAWLQLEDLDWRAGELVVRGKARRHDRLPLPAGVGEALAGYLVAAPARPQARRRRPPAAVVRRASRRHRPRVRHRHGGAGVGVRP